MVYSARGDNILHRDVDPCQPCLALLLRKCAGCDRPLLPMSHPFWSLPGVTSHHKVAGGEGGGRCQAGPQKSNISASDTNIYVTSYLLVSWNFDSLYK